MLYDIERTIAKLDKNYKSDEYLRLVYDLESFIIDNCHNDGSEDIEQLEREGKLQLRSVVVHEYEKNFAYAKLRPVLVSLGIQESVKGFRMLQMLVLECAKRTLDGKTYQMMEIYPIVAEDFGINAHNCERLCRYACDYAKPTLRFANKYPSLEELCHRTYEKVTVKELVDLLVRYLITDCKFRRKSFLTK